jgi:hypothetical protein
MKPTKSQWAVLEKMKGGETIDMHDGTWKIWQGWLVTVPRNTFGALVKNGWIELCHEKPLRAFLPHRITEVGRKAIEVKP